MNLLRRRTLMLGAAGSTAALAGCAPLLQRLGLKDAPLSTEQARALAALDTQGARALLANDVDGAIAAWRRYVQLAPRGLARARQLRGHLTLLDREAARRFVQRAVAQEAQRSAAPGDRLHVAVLPFTTAGAGTGAAQGFNRAVAAMIAVDLACVPGLTVLERDKVELLVQELGLSASGLVDPTTAARPGRLLGAGTLVAGSVLNEAGPAGPGSGRYRIAGTVSEVARARLLGHHEAEGRQDDFFRLQKQVVHGILDLLDVGVGARPAEVDHIHTRNWQAYARFARGLELLAEDRFDEAREAFAAALGLDPAFVLAEDALLGTPARAASFDELRAAAARVQ